MDHEELTTFYAVADNGDALRVEVRPHLVPEAIRRWPAFGLERRTEPVEPLDGELGLGDHECVVPSWQPSSDHPDDDAWDIYGQTLTVWAARRMEGLVPIHSAVIAWNGRAIVVPVSSEAGKSTLCVAASEAGATILSDEYALADPKTGLVRGWTRPVRIHPEDGPVKHLDIAVPSEPIAVGLLAFIEHDPDLSGDPPIAWESIHPSQAVVELLAHTVCARRRPDDSLDAALAMARTAPAIQGRRGEATAMVRALLAAADEAGATPADPIDQR